MKNLLFVIFIATSLFSKAQITPVGTVDDFEYRLLFIRISFNNTAEVDAYIDIMERAANACYNGVAVSDNQFGYLDSVYSPAIYFGNLQRFLSEARVLNLSVYPQNMIFVGHSLLQNNPNLAEGVPVKDAPFIVENRGGELVLVNDPNDTFPLLNGDFESVDNMNQFSNWFTGNEWNSAIFRDTSVKYSGNASVRFTDPGNYGAGHISIIQPIQVIPYRDYHLSVWVKTNAYTNTGGIGISVYNTNDSKRYLQWNNPPLFSCSETPNIVCARIPLEQTQDWTKYEFTFNTLENSELYINIRSWNGGSGNAWFDEMKVEPTRFNNIIRREDRSVPVVIKHENNSILQEGIHIEKIVDNALGSFTVWHEQPLVKIINGNNILQAGDKVFASYYHSTFIYNGPSGPSLTHPDIFDLTYNQLNLVRNEWLAEDLFEGWFFGHDELRVHNWEEDPPGYTLGTPAENLEYNFNTIYNQAKSIDSNAKIMVWNDMFDPYHNAKKEEELNNPYYLVNDYWDRDDATSGIPSDVIIMNWLGDESLWLESGRFFADNGHQQILSGYYDKKDFGSDYYIDDWWLELQANNIAGIAGVMYTTWTYLEGYDNLEEWAEMMWGGCAGDCEDFENVTTVNEDLEIGAQIQLTSNATIPSDKQVKFVAGKTVKLEAGFKFSSDGTGTFKAMRGNCPE